MSHKYCSMAQPVLVETSTNICAYGVYCCCGTVLMTETILMLGRTKASKVFAAGDKVEIARYIHVLVVGWCAYSGIHLKKPIDDNGFYV